ncbi:hypothetical protein [Microbacterium cremeum]|uniref:hypothetical protein n=1 Tax=Microbacterium cremeum TaxID=2782169 RepID=UPI0018880F2B|nr:hypothetical protein [Microbacterium cremeum]
MRSARVHPLVTRLAVIVGLVAIGAGGSGCAAPTVQADPTPAATVTVTAAPGPVVVSAEVTDEQSCEAFVDVSTILFNAETGLREGRMIRQEYTGWLQLATRVLDRVPTRGEGAVSDAIAALKQGAPAIPAGGTGPTDIGTSEWYSSAELVDACREAGYELFTVAFTGG